MLKCETLGNTTQFNDLVMEINILDSKYNLENTMLDFCRCLVIFDSV